MISHVRWRIEHESEFEFPLDDIGISIDVVKDKLNSLKAYKSPGPDGLHPRLLKETADELVLPLSKIFRNSISSGIVPDDWKYANVTAVFKKGNRHLALNYRPRSLTSVSCKLLESIIRDGVVDHMTKNKIFSRDQHGFIKGRSCMTQLIEVLNQWTNILDSGGSIDVAYLDIMKAFDTVPHERLLVKLSSYGIVGKTLEWIKSFLTSRRQRVVVNGEVSDWSDVTSGVPQGSVLGPILFLCYINDLPLVIQNKVKVFAGDTKIYSEVDSVEDCRNLQKDLHQISDWSKRWDLKFHPQKCKILRIGKNNSSFEYFMSDSDGNSVILDVVDQEKHLGVTIDKELTFRQHADLTVSKANRIMGLIRRSFTYLDERSFAMLFKALVRPILEYNNTIWHPRF